MNGIHDQVFWYPEKISYSPSLTQDMNTDVAIVGGGMAGLSAAQAFHARGLKVALLEKEFCGSGASGKSSGFITPNSELSLESLVRSHGSLGAKRLWDFASTGVELIKKNIQEYSLSCDYTEQDTLVLANTQRAFTGMLVPEHAARQKLGYPSALLPQEHVHHIIGSEDYRGGLAYPGSFGIQVYRYCAGMKGTLQEQGVQIYEQTPVTDIQDHAVHTPRARVRAEHIIVCTDYQDNSLTMLKDNVYHVQTFLMVSHPLSGPQVKRLFPERHCMVWDTDTIYHYYRLTPDNRLMVGGASLLDTYASQENHHNTRIIKQLLKYIDRKFPGLDVTFEYTWPGLIGVSKDLLPLAGHDRTMPEVYCIAAATGLPWAAALGAHSAARVLEGDVTFDADFSPYRHFFLGGFAQRVLGTPLTFAVSNFLAAQSF